MFSISRELTGLEKNENISFDDSVILRVHCIHSVIPSTPSIPTVPSCRIPCQCIPVALSFKEFVTVTDRVSPQSENGHLEV